LCDTYNVQPNAQQNEELLSAARLKKKEIQLKKFKPAKKLAGQDSKV